MAYSKKYFRPLGLSKWFSKRINWIIIEAQEDIFLGLVKHHREVELELVKFFFLSFSDRVATKSSHQIAEYIVIDPNIKHDFDTFLF